METKFCITLSFLACIATLVAGQTPVGSVPATSGAVPVSSLPGSPIPASIFPSGAVPVSKLPSGAVPVSSLPSGAVPVSTLTSGAVPVATLPSGAVPVSTLPSGAVPVSTLPSGAVPVSTLPSGAVPVSTLPSGVVPVSTLPSGAVPVPAGPQPCKRPLDLVFVIAKTSSLGDANFNAVKTTLTNAISVLKVSASEVRVGAVFYGAKPDVVELQVTADAFTKKIAAIPFVNPGSDSAVGLAEATRILNAARRPGVPIAVLLVTNEVSSDRPTALRVRNDAVSYGIDIWATRVGPSADVMEMRALASQSDQLFGINTVAQIPATLANLAKTVCEKAVLRPDMTAAAPISPLEGICRASPSFEGVRYITYPDDCTKVMQCYENAAKGKFLVVTRTCPFGQFWDQTKFTCAPSWTVECRYDKCRGFGPYQQSKPQSVATQNTNAVAVVASSSASVVSTKSGVKVAQQAVSRSFSAGRNGPCGGYWECREGRAYPKCCAPFLRYQPLTQSCEASSADSNCWDSCSINGVATYGIAPCFKYPDWTKPANYMTTTDSKAGPAPKSCPYGGTFDLHRCRCDDILRQLLTRAPPSVCAPAYQDTKPVVCNEPNMIIPVVISRKEGTQPTVVFSVTLNTVTPGFEIILTSTGVDQFSFTITSDSEGIHASLNSNSNKRELRRVTSLYMNAYGPLDLKVMYRENLLVLSATQGKVTHISQAEVAVPTICTDCRMNLQIKGPQGCTRQSVEIFACETALHNLF